MTPDQIRADDDDSDRVRSTFDRADNTARLALELAEAKREIARLRAELTELAPSDEVEVEGSFFQRADLPRVLGNHMRSSAEHGREAKALHLELAAAKRDIADLHRDALAEAQAYRAMFARAQEAEAKVERMRSSKHCGCAWCCASTKPLNRGEGHKICGGE